jgi:hypothetical protein
MAQTVSRREAMSVKPGIYEKPSKHGRSGQARVVTETKVVNGVERVIWFRSGGLCIRQKTAASPIEFWERWAKKARYAPITKREK